jgi:hypothetical protein
MALVVEEREDLVLLYHDDVHVYPVPFAAFQSPEERREFVEHVRAKIAAEAGRGALAPGLRANSRHAVSAPRPRRNAADVPGEFSTAVKLISFRRVSEGDLAVSWLQIVGLVIATLLPPLAFAAVSIGDSGHFDYTYLPQVLFHVTGDAFSPRSCSRTRSAGAPTSPRSWRARCSRGPRSTSSRWAPGWR